MLFDVEALRALLGADRAATVRLRYVEHEPGERAMVMAAVGDRLVAASIGCTAPAGDGVRVSWYPDDPGLPGLREGWGVLLGRLGVELGDEAQPECLAWVPHRRLVVAVGVRGGAGSGAVVKLHATGDETQRAVDCARTVGAVARVPEVLAADVALAAHVQRRVVGRALGRSDALDAVPAACEILEHLGQVDPAGLVHHTAGALLAHARRVADLVAFISPHERDRVDGLLAALAARRPADPIGVASHGDFNVGQLLVADDGGLVLVDTDTLCAAAPSYDPASYAANLVAGRAGDLDDAAAALAAFVRARPGLDGAELRWYLAAMVVRRLDRGLRRYKRDWPARTERLIGAACELVAGL